MLVGVISQKNKGYALLLWAGIASLIPASFTVEDIPNIQRSSMFIIPLVIVIAFGIRAFWLSLRTTKLRVIFISFCGVCFISSFGISIHEYFGHGKTHKTWYRNNGEKTLVHALYPYAKAKEAVYVTASADNDEMYYLWYLKIPPHALQHIPRGKKLAALFPTFTFIADDCVLHKKTWAPSRLYVSLGSCKAVPGSVVERTILREDGTTAFVFLRSGTTYPWAD